MKVENIEFLRENLKKSVTLVGLMGAGKSSIGRHLAKALELEFVDSDNLVEGAQRRTIEQIFKISGEPYFRELERNCIIDLANEPEIKIIGTGGGAFMNPETRQAIKKKTISIFLEAEIETLAKRVGHGLGRPLFEGKDPINVLTPLIKQRYPIYKEADIIVKTKIEPLNETLNRVMEALYSNLSQR